MPADPKTYYAVLCIKFSNTVSIKDITGVKMEGEMKLVWATGMVGCMPVFTDRKSALAYAGDQYKIVEIIGEIPQ